MSDKEIVISGVDGTLEKEGDSQTVFSCNDPSEQLCQWWYFIIGVQA
jgi:hypothetical protein